MPIFLARMETISRDVLLDFGGHKVVSGKNVTSRSNIQRDPRGC